MFIMWGLQKHGQHCIANMKQRVESTTYLALMLAFPNFNRNQKMLVKSWNYLLTYLINKYACLLLSKISCTLHTVLHLKKWIMYQNRYVSISKFLCTLPVYLSMPFYLEGLSTYPNHTDSHKQDTVGLHLQLLRLTPSNTLRPADYLESLGSL